MDIHKLDKEELVAHAEKLNKALSKSEKKFTNIFNSFEDIFFRACLNGEISIVSPSSKRITGYDENELVGQDVTNFYLYSPLTKNLLRQLANEKEIRDVEISIVHKYGKIIPAKCILRLVYDEKWYVEGVVRDESNLVHIREELDRAIKIARRSLRVKEDFLANMSHEIRTPLNGILGMTSVLASSDLSTDQMKQVNAIQQSSDILLRLLNNILDWSKLEAGKMNVQLSVVSPDQLIKKVFTVYEQKATEKNIKLSYQVNKKVPEYIYTDELKLVQVYSNLVSNAIKFTPVGGNVDIRLYVEKERDKNLLLRGEVRDTGIGINEADYKNLFSSFTQLDSSSIRKHEGAGLGLSISKEIINLLGGEIGVTSKLKSGSIFWFTFICEKAEKKHAEKSEVFEQHKLFTVPHVLLVDDNKINLEVAGQILKRIGAVVVTVDSGEEAIKLLMNNKFDIILLDIQMPEMSGIEVMKWMKDNLSSVPPTLALTAYSGEGEKDKFLSEGFDDFIAKPIAPEELIGRVREWTEKQEKILDRNVIEKLVEFGGKKMVKDAMQDFCDETEEQIKECFVSLSESNHKRILDQLHTIKGNAGTLGVNRVARKAKQIEEQLIKGYVTELEQELKGLEYFFKEFKVHYNDH
ncbi:MAG: response regulator [Candidatus Cyclobacteriaceae bacterium M2_1C_046]